MIMRRFERRRAAEPLPEALLALGLALTNSADADEALDRLTRGLAERNVAYALLSEGPEAGAFLVERATLPLSPEVWGRPLQLPKLAAALARGRPLALANTADSFAEGSTTGSRRELLVAPVAGTLVVAPLALTSGRSALLCLVSPDLGEADRTAVWALAMQLGAAMREGVGVASRAAAPEPAPGGNLSLFHELTRRLSHSLADDEVVQAAFEVLAPAIGLQLAGALSCRDGKHVTTVYAPPRTPDAVAERIASSTDEAFVKLTGARHESCSAGGLHTTTLAAAGAGALSEPPASALDAPLVIEGEVVGLLRIATARPGAFDAEQERAFFTVANQVSLALERVTAQRRAERAQLASLAESLSDGVVLVDSTLRVTSLNEAARGLLAALANWSVAEGASLTDTPLEAPARAALAAAAPTPLTELPPDPAAAGRRYLVAMAAPLAGSPEGSAAVVVLRDVTEERLMQERLLQSEKMVSVGQLVSGVAHELNNPLTGIMGFAQLLLARELDERTRRDLETIHTEAERASKIVQNLLSFARRRHAQKESANLNTLVERVLELRNYDLRMKNIDVELDLDPELPETMVDADQIQQVFLNVIVNAEQAMLVAKERGTLTVRTRRDGDVIGLSIQDDGPGIETETLRRIFDPFFTTKETGEGTGLGLTISYGIIEDHGGRIWADSRPGRGTTFHIELPVLRGAGRPRAPQDERQTAAGPARSILVVDDEESIQRLLGSILQMDGHAVDTARNGAEALEYLTRHRYDLVITDIKMPDMDGRELYQRLKELDSELARRTVFITGDTVSPETRRFLQQIRNPCLAKPFRMREVRETVLKVLADEG